MTALSCVPEGCYPMGTSACGDLARITVCALVDHWLQFRSRLLGGQIQGLYQTVVRIPRPIPGPDAGTTIELEGRSSWHGANHQ